MNHKATLGVFKEPQGMLCHGGAFLYVTGGYILGLLGTLHDSWFVAVAATALLGHAMVIGAYMIHECAHNTVFRNNQHNAWLGTLLMWVCGVPYETYEDIRYKHFRHHVDNADIVWYSLRSFGDNHPYLLRIILLFEWFYLPVHEAVQHIMMCFVPFLIAQRREQRTRVVVVSIVRICLFCTLAYLIWKAAILYLVAYAFMIHVLRWMDGLQHDYGSNPIMYENVEIPNRGDSIWEQVHTFSNMHSLKWPWINWFTLNFGYHNAHHHLPTAPWYRLPALHRELFHDDPSEIIPLKSQLAIYHRERVRRISQRGPPLEGRDFLRGAQSKLVQGGNGVSFLVSF